MLSLDLEQVRAKSIADAAALAIRILPTLPLLDAITRLRTLDEITSRALAMTPASATAYRYPREKALRWIRQEDLDHSLTPSESQFLATGVGDQQPLIDQIEGIWALAWALSIVPALDFTKDCDNTFYKLMPDLSVLESSAAFRARARLREPKDIVQACDFAYCLHWAVRDAHLRRTPLRYRLRYPVVSERRRALEWIIDPDTPWEEISLDT